MALGVEVTFSPRGDRDPTVAPVCVVGLGDAARALAKRALAMDARSLAALSGVATDDALFLLGAADALPWVDGAIYLGRDPAAPRLLLPTQLCPDVPVDVLERALVQHARRGQLLEGPFAILTAPAMLVSVHDAGPIDREALERWLSAAP